MHKIKLKFNTNAKYNKNKIRKFFKKQSNKRDILNALIYRERNKNNSNNKNTNKQLTIAKC